VALEGVFWLYMPVAAALNFRWNLGNFGVFIPSLVRNIRCLDIDDTHESYRQLVFLNRNWIYFLVSGENIICLVYQVV
jgi:hypothetical protein